ncbi:MAG: hypothetical protein B7Z53_02625 [Rhodospirillales bacterium 12-71-4]|nr:MAG: hypothetical protein B7Z53_02625 [Rhodospirillales bacterium 12-71-4]
MALFTADLRLAGMAYGRCVPPPLAQARLMAVETGPAARLPGVLQVVVDAPRGLVGVIWIENGFRNLTNSRREVNTPADVRGLKIRTMENQVHMRAFTTLGALPTPMAFSELVPALQQGTVDGQENPISVIVANNLNQVQRYMTMTRHVYSPQVMICNPAMIARLSQADRALFQQAAREAQVANRARVSADDEAGVAELRRRGMTVITQVDTAAFQAALAPAFAEWERTLDSATLRRIRDWRAN